MAELPTDRCHELENDHIHYGDGFVRKLAVKFSEAACNNGQRSATAETAPTNCLLGAKAAICNHDDAVTPVSVSGSCQTDHENHGNAVLCTSSTTHSSTPTSASDPTTIPAGKFTKKCSVSPTTQLTASNDLSECRVGTVASAKRLFEGLSSSLSSLPCSQSLTGNESKSVTPQSTSDSEAISSGYSSLSAATSSSESMSPQTDDSGELNDNNVTPVPVDVTSNIPDAALSDALCVGLSDTDTSPNLCAATTASDSLSSCDDVSRNEVFLSVESNVANDTAEVSQLQTDITTLSSMEDVSPGCINYAVTSGEDQSSLLEKKQVEKCQNAQEEAVTGDLTPETEIVSDNNLNIKKTSSSEYDFCNVLSDIEVCGSINSTDALPFYLSTNEREETEVDYSSEARESMSAEYIDESSHFDINSMSLDCATSSRQLRTVQAVHQATPVQPGRPMYWSIIHMGSQPDDVVIETVEDPPSGQCLRDNRCYVTHSVSLLITEPRDQSATTVRPRKRVPRSRSDPGLLVRQLVVCAGAEYVGRERSMDDCDEWHGNNGDLMTAYAHLLTAPLTPLRRRQKVFIDNTVFCIANCD